VRLLASAERNVFSENVFQQNWSDVVESGTDTTTVWSRDGVGNRWSRYGGFDFDGNGIGDSPHLLLRPFEQVEAANELARLYLQSPAASALDLAARGAARARRPPSCISVDGEISECAEGRPAKAGHYGPFGRSVLLIGAFMLLIVPAVRARQRR
jgi:nitrous oxidase accessory protein NosD